MTLGYTGYPFGRTLSTQQICSEYSMPDIFLRSVAVYAIGIGHKNTNVVEHCRRLDGFRIEPEPKTSVYPGGKIGDRARMALKNIPRSRTGQIIFVVQSLIIVHISLLKKRRQTHQRVRLRLMKKEVHSITVFQPYSSGYSPRRMALRRS